MKIHCSDKQAYSCTSCGKCCSIWDVPITSAERDRLLKLKLPSIDFSKKDYFTKYKKVNLYKLNQDENQRCLFLDNDNLCLIHKHYGEPIKPLACRLHPYEIFTWSDNEVSASFKFDCPEVAKSSGRSIKSHQKDIAQLAKELNKTAKKATAIYAKNIPSTINELRRISETYDNIFTNNNLSANVKILAASRLLEYYSHPNFSNQVKKLHISFEENSMTIVNSSKKELENMIKNAESMNVNHRVSLRYILSGYARVDEESGAGRFSIERMKRVVTITKFILGQGALSSFCERLSGSTAIDPVQCLRSVQCDDEILQPYWNYLSSKLRSMHFFGYPAFDLSFEEGLRHLVMTYPIIRLLSAQFAVSDNRKNVSESDIINSLEVIDHTFSKSIIFNLNHVKNIIKKMVKADELASILHGFR